MKPSPPTKVIYILGMLLGILGIVSHYTHIKHVSPHSFYLILAGFVLLALGTTFKDL